MNNRTFTITLSAMDSIHGFNNNGDRYSATRNADNKYNVGHTNLTSYVTRLGVVDTHGEALAWVVDKLAQR